MSTLGNYFKEKREERDLSLDEITQDTKLSKKQLEAIEADNFDLLPAPPYRQIFLRTYAEYLEISPSEFAKMMRDLKPTTQKVSPVSTSRLGRVFNLSFIGIAMLLAGAVLLLVSEETSTSAKPQADQIISATGAKNPLSGLTSAEELLPNKSEKAMELRIQAQGQTEAIIWTESDTLFQGILRPGQVGVWKSWQNFNVIIQHPKLVKLFLDGKNIEYQPGKDSDYKGVKIFPEKYTVMP